MNEKPSMIAEVIAMYIAPLLNKENSEWEAIMKEVYIEDRYIYDQVFLKLEGICTKSERWLTEKKYYITTLP